MAYPIGRLMDRVGRRKGLSVGYLLGILGTLVTGFSVIQESLLCFLAGILGLGFTRGVVDQGRYAAAEANLPERRARSISLVVLGGTMGSIVGPLLITYTGNLAESAGLPLLSGPWFGASLFFMLSLGIITLFLRPDPHQIAQQWALEIPQPLSGSSEHTRSLREIFRDPKIQIATGSMIVGQLVMVLLMAITPVHMHLAHHHISAISIVVMAHTVGMFGLSFLVGWLVDTWGKMTMIVVGSGILISACLLSPLSTSAVWLAVGLFLLGLGWNCCYVAGSTLLTERLLPSEKGRVQGFNDTLISLHSAIGGLASGFVFSVMGFLVMSWVSIFIALIPIFLVLFFAKAEQPDAILSQSVDFAD